LRPNVNRLGAKQNLLAVTPVFSTVRYIVVFASLAA
jgi:hypothetical protein